MKGRVLIVAGLLALTVGFAGIAALSWLPASSTPQDRPVFSAGQRIYYLGLDAQGRPIPRSIAGGGMMGFGMMGAGACVDCHGEDGRGGRVGMMFGQIDIPDIRYATLTSPRSEDGTEVAGWTDADMARAIREGVEPNGELLKAPMPRWGMTDAEVSDVIAYLKELNAR